MEERTNPASVSFSGGILSINLAAGEVATFATTATNTVSITFNASLTNGGMDGSPLVVTSTKTSGSITGNLTSATATTRISVTGSGGAGDNVVFTAYDAPAAALDFDANLSLLDINGNVTCASLACSTVSNLGGNVITTGVQAYGGASTLTSTVSLNSNGNAIQFGSTLAGGANNLTLASGIGMGAVDFIGSVSNLGSGTGAALTVASGVTGQVHFNSTLAGNSGIVSSGGSNVRFDGNVSLGNGTTATSLGGISLFNGVAFSGFDGLDFGTLQLATAASSLNSNGSAIQVGSLSGSQNLTLAAGIGAGTTTVSGLVSNLGSGIGAALTVSSGVTGLVRFQSVVGANSGISATGGSSLRFDDDVTLGNGDTATSLAGNVQLDGLSLSGFDGISMNAVTLSGAGVTFNSNGGAIQLGTLTGAQNLSLAAGIGSGATTVTGTVTNLGSGTGAALSVASGVTGLVWFQNTLGANSGLVAAAGTQCQIDGNTTLGNGDTASSFSGTLTLDGLSLNAFDGITVNSAILSTAAVSLQSTAGNISLGNINGAQALTLDSGSVNDTLVLGMVGNLAAPTGLTIANASTAYFYDKVTVGGPILINNATLNVAFGETVLASSITSLATANNYSVSMTGSGTIITGATLLSNTGSVVIGNSTSDMLLFGGGLDVSALTPGYASSIAGFIGSSAAPIHLDRVLLSADATLDTTNAGASPAGASLSLTGGVTLAGNTLTTRTGLAGATDLTGILNLGGGQVVSETGNINLGTSLAGATITMTGDILVQAKGGNITVGALTTIAGGGNSLTLRSDDIFINSGPGSISGLTTVALEPFTMNRSIFLGSATSSPAPGLKISQSMINSISASGLVIGQSGDSGLVTVGNSASASPLTIVANGGGGKVQVTGPLVSTAMTGIGVTILGSGATTVLGANIVTAGTPVVINDAVQVDANVTIDTTATGAVPAGANIDITGGAAGIFATSGKTYGLIVTGGTAGVITLGALKGFGTGGTGSLVTGLMVTGASTVLPTQNLLDGAVSVSAAAISVGADLTAGAGLSITGALALTGNSVLTGDGVTINGGINADNHNLSLDGMSGMAGSGPISVSGAITNAAALAVLDSTGAAFGGAVAALSAQINGTNTGTIAFADNLNIAGGISAAAGTYALSIFGTSNTIGGPVSFGNTGPVSIGNNDGDGTTIGSGLARLTQTNLQGTIKLGGSSTLGLVNATTPGGKLDITADSLNIGYNNAGNAFGPLIITASNAVNLTGGALASATLNVNAGSLGQSGGTLAVVGSSSLSCAGTIHLPDANSFGGDLTFNGSNVTIRDTTSLSLSGAGAATGNLVLSSPLGISQSGGSLTVSGSAVLTTPGASISLDKANNFASVGITSAANATINDINALVLDSITLGGSLLVTTGGAVTQSAALSVAGLTTINAPISGNMTLGLANNLGGGITFTGKDVILNNATSLTLSGPSLANGNLTVSATGALNGIGGLITVGGNAGFTGVNIGLANLNVAGTIGISTGGNATILNNLALSLAASSISGTLNAGAITGNITDTALVTIGGNGNFTTYQADADIFLDQTIVTGSIILSTTGTTGDSTYATGAPINLAGGAVAGSLTLFSTSTISQSAPFSATGAVDLTGTDITLANPGNSFTGPVTFSANSVSLADLTNMPVGPGTAMGNLTLSAPSITQSGTLAVAGTTTLSTSKSDIILNDSANTFGGAVAINSAGGATINASTALLFTNSSVGGNFASTSMGIDQVLGSSLFVAGSSTLAAASGADILLDNAGNDFVGPVGFGARDVRLTDANNLVLGPGKASGTLQVQSVGIGQGGAISIAGSTSLISSGGDISLADPMNVFTGSVTFTGKNTALAASNSLEIAMGTAVGTLSLSGLSLSQTGTIAATGASSLAANAGDIVFMLANTFGGPVGLSATNASLNNIVATSLNAGTISGTMELTSGGTVSQAAGALAVSGATTVNAAGFDISLGSPANALAGGFNFQGRDVSVTNTLDLALAGIATGNLSADAAGDISDSMPVSAGGTASFNATGTGHGILVDQLSALGLITAGTADGNAAIVNSGSISFAGTVAGLFSLSALSGGISDGGPVSATGGLEITAPGASSLAQALAGPGGLTFNGTGTLAVSGANTFTGDTNINAGTLVLTGSLAKSDVIVAGGTLRGTGDMASLSAKGGTVRPGQSAGSFLSSGPANLGAGNNYVVEVNGTVPGTGYSQIVSDGVTLAGTLGLVQTVPFTPMIGSHYTIIDNTGALPVSGTFAGLPEGSTVNLGSQRFIITYQGGTGANDVVLTAINTVPAPTGPVITAPFSLARGVMVSATTGLVQLGTTGGVFRQFRPFAGYVGLVDVDTVDRTGDGKADALVVSMASTGSAGTMMVIDAATGRQAYRFNVFPGFMGGARVSAGIADLGGTLRSLIVAGAGPGANPAVKVYDSVYGTVLRQFNAFGTSYRGGVDLALSNPDSLGKSILAVGSLVNANVRVFDLNNTAAPLYAFRAFSTPMSSFSIRVGDINGDGFNEIIGGVGSGILPLLRVFQPNGTLLKQIQPFTSSYSGGVNIGLGDIDNDGTLEIIAGAAQGTRGLVKAYKANGAVVYSNFISPVITSLTLGTNLTIIS